MMGQSTLSRRSAGAWGSTRLTGFCCFSVEERSTSGGAGWAPMGMGKASNSPSLALPHCSLPFLSVRPLGMELEEFLSRK